VRPSLDTIHAALRDLEACLVRGDRAVIDRVLAEIGQNSKVDAV